MIRAWRILVLLRSKGPQTSHELARTLGTCERTIRRDLKALQAVPLPITPRFDSRDGVRACERQLWAWGETPAWPRREPGPIADVAAWLEARA